MSTSGLPTTLATSRKLRGFCIASLPLRPTAWKPCLQSISRSRHSSPCTRRALSLRYSTSRAVLGASPATRPGGTLSPRLWGQLLQPVSRRNVPRPTPAMECRMRFPFRCPRAGPRELLPAEDLEHLFLHGRHFVFRQPWVDHVVLGPRSSTAQPQHFLSVRHPRFLELEPLPSHEQQGDHVTKVDPGGVGFR